MQLLNLLLMGFAVGALVLAACFGGRIEKLGAAAFAAALFLTWGAQIFPGTRASPGGAFVLIDLSLGLVLLGLFLHSGLRLWVAVAGIAQSLLIVLSIVRFLGYPLHGIYYIGALNVATNVALLALCAGVWEHHARRRTTPISGRFSLIG